MIVYDRKPLENIGLVEQTKRLQKANFIGQEQLQMAIKDLPVLKSQHNILIRLGFFLLGLFLYGSICSVICLFGLEAIDQHLAVLVYIFAIVGFVGAEFLAHKHYFGFGLDDAFILGAQVILATAIGVSTDGSAILPILIVVTIVSFLMYLRYLHLVSALIFCLGLAGTLGYVMVEYIVGGKAILPFVMMLLAIGLFYGCRRLLSSLTVSFYHKGILLIKSFSLILFYLSGNYLVVRELSYALSGIYSDIHPEIPFAFFFWLFSFIVPVVYLFFALRNKDRILLWIGFLSFCFSIYTFKYYYDSVSTATVLTFMGLLLFALTYWLIKKIKDNNKGVTFQPDRLDHGYNFLNAEALIVAAVFGMKTEIQPADPMEFGGGGFSGGGSEGSF
jgi:hypothetical protein